MSAAGSILPAVAAQVAALTIILGSVAAIWRWAKPRLRRELVELIDDRIECKLLSPNGGRSNSDISAKVDTLTARFDDHLAYHRASPPVSAGP